MPTPVPSPAVALLDVLCSREVSMHPCAHGAAVFLLDIEKKADVAVMYVDVSAPNPRMH